MSKKTQSIKVTVVDRKTGEEFIFESVNKASSKVGVSSMQISRILRGKSKNLTNYFITGD